MGTFDDGADGASLVVATARTNVANQIQRHLLHMGFPVCCDKHYGNFRVNRRFAGVFGLNRVFLHCFEVDAVEASDLSASKRVAGCTGTSVTPKRRPSRGRCCMDWHGPVISTLDAQRGFCWRGILVRKHDWEKK